MVQHTPAVLFARGKHAYTFDPIAEDAGQFPIRTTPALLPSQRLDGSRFLDADASSSDLPPHCLSSLVPRGGTLLMRHTESFCNSPAFPPSLHGSHLRIVGMSVQMVPLRVAVEDRPRVCRSVLGPDETIVVAIHCDEARDWAMHRGSSTCDTHTHT